MINEEDFSSKQDWQEAKDNEDKFSIEGSGAKNEDYDFDQEEQTALTAIDETAIAINEVYRAYLRSGFNKEQAFDLATIHLERALDMNEMSGEDFEL